ncbi:putative dead box ATP-dependent RNA helicase [Planoprotostelium fungivorum]|uniref:Putative dead box ATP-dependent RNA helicase n=1 Tax=Planoprotostelium fungivorum TaxID=1890364 RepID=A0A2P6NDK8_9EUKA|nr:putative dead box ATP-dependent RNA helicase [Planoprotostelium fungivorum]
MGKKDKDSPDDWMPKTPKKYEWPRDDEPSTKNNNNKKKTRSSTADVQQNTSPRPSSYLSVLKSPRSYILPPQSPTKDITKSRKKQKPNKPQGRTTEKTDSFVEVITDDVEERKEKRQKKERPEDVVPAHPRHRQREDATPLDLSFDDFYSDEEDAATRKRSKEREIFSKEKKKRDASIDLIEDMEDETHKLPQRRREEKLKLKDEILRTKTPLEEEINDSSGSEEERMRRKTWTLIPGRQTSRDHEEDIPEDITTDDYSPPQPAADVYLRMRSILQPATPQRPKFISPPTPVQKPTPKFTPQKKVTPPRASIEEEIEDSHPHTPPFDHLVTTQMNRGVSQEEIESQNSEDETVHRTRERYTDHMEIEETSEDIPESSSRDERKVTQDSKHEKMRFEGMVRRLFGRSEGTSGSGKRYIDSLNLNGIDTQTVMEDQWFPNRKRKYRRGGLVDLAQHVLQKQTYEKNRNKNNTHHHVTFVVWQTKLDSGIMAVYGKIIQQNDENIIPHFCEILFPAERLQLDHIDMEQLGLTVTITSYHILQQSPFIILCPSAADVITGGTIELKMEDIEEMLPVTTEYTIQYDGRDESTGRLDMSVFDREEDPPESQVSQTIPRTSNRLSFIPLQSDVHTITLTLEKCTVGGTEEETEEPSFTRRGRRENRRPSKNPKSTAEFRDGEGQRCAVSEAVELRMDRANREGEEIQVQVRMLRKKQDEMRVQVQAPMSTDKRKRPRSDVESEEEELAHSVLMYMSKPTLVVSCAEGTFPKLSIINNAARDLFWDEISKIANGEDKLSAEFMIEDRLIRFEFQRLEVRNVIHIEVSLQVIEQLNQKTADTQFLINLLNYGPNLSNIQECIHFIEEEFIPKLIGVTNISVIMAEIIRRDNIKYIAVDRNFSRIVFDSEPQQIKGKTTIELHQPLSDVEKIYDLYTTHLLPSTRTSTFVISDLESPSDYNGMMECREIAPQLFVCMTIWIKKVSIEYSSAPRQMEMVSIPRSWDTKRWDSFMEDCLQFIIQNPKFSSVQRYKLPADFENDTQNVFCYAYRGEFLPSGNSDGFFWRPSRGTVASGSRLRKRYFYSQTASGSRLKRRVVWLEADQSVRMVEYRNHEHNGIIDVEKLVGPPELEWKTLLRDMHGFISPGAGPQASTVDFSQLAEEDRSSPHDKNEDNEE